MPRSLAANVAIAVLSALAATAQAASFSWIDDAVVYGVVPQLAGPRGLADVTEHLDHIARLGATVLWLSPIAESAPGDFGYAVTDPFHVRRGIGSAADLRALVAGAHARGLKVILDIAVNDLSDRHPYYQDAQRRQAQSPYYDFFDRGADGKATHYFDWTNLENLDYANPRVRRYVLAVFAHWLRDFDVDGFRVDAAWGVRQRSPDFWPLWSAALRRIKPDLLLLAEASERDPYYKASGFDAAYDWTGKLGEWAWDAAFRSGTPASGLRAALAAEDDRAPIFRFLDNNDTGRRFISRYGPDEMRVAAAMLMTLPGLPCVYMGEEDGAVFEPYAQRQPIAWDGFSGIGEELRRLIALRRAEPALRSRQLSLLRSSNGAEVLAYLRPGAGADQSLLVLLNYGRVAHDVSLLDAGPARDVLGGKSVTDLISGETIAIDPRAPVLPLPPLSARVLRRGASR